ncbi:copper homeostasis protein CutC [Micrococcaceae bacterium Sec5.7]
MVEVEICVQDIAGVRCALEAGAQRVEICTALATGGLTPSIGLVEAAAGLARTAGASGFVQVLIRPRPGGYVYSADELLVMTRDIRCLLAAGADGVVVGALTADGGIDESATAALIGAASGAPATFHRAVDAAADPVRTAAAAARLGAIRILTSGGSPRAGGGAALLRRMVQSLPEGVQVMAGGGVGAESVRELIASGVGAIHFSGKRDVSDPHPSGPGGGAGTVTVTDPAIVRGLIQTIRSLG